jgi:hypothetical protein
LPLVKKTPVLPLAPCFAARYTVQGYAPPIIKSKRNLEFTYMINECSGSFKKIMQDFVSKKIVKNEHDINEQMIKLIIQEFKDKEPILTAKAGGELESIITVLIKHFFSEFHYMRYASKPK